MKFKGFVQAFSRIFFLGRRATGFVWGLVLAGVALSECSAISAAIRINVPAVIEVVEPRVSLARFLESEKLAPELRKKVEKRIVTSAPSPGESKSISVAELQRQLESAGLSADRYLLSFPTELVIKRKSQEVSAAEVSNHVVHEYISRLPWKTVELEKLEIVDAIILPVGKTAWSFSVAANTDLAKPFYLNINIQVDGEIVKRLFVRTVLVIRESVPVVIKELKPSQSVRPEDIRWEIQKIGSSINAPVADVAFFQGRRPRVVIGAGRVLTKDLFISVPMIQRGDNVLLVLESEQMRLSTQTKALSTGSFGQRIQVMNPDSGKILSAEVLSPGKARLVF